jgi:glycosyltransferase involved in cell wall biosynthesis
VKVLLVSSLERGGPVEQTLLLSRGLRDLGVRVGVICGSEEVALRFAQAGFAPTRLPLGQLAGAARLWRLMDGADVVHAQDRRSGLWTRLVPGMPRVARVYTVHGLPDPYLPPPVGLLRPALRDRLAYEGLDSLLARRADALIIPSRALAEIFVSRLRFPAPRITVVPNGVVARPRLEQRGDEVGTLSMLEPVKDIPTFLRAAAILAARHPKLRFVVAGDGSQREALEREAAELGIAERVSFPGFVSSAEALRRLAVLVMPSVIENAPMAVLEAMAAGVPVVASRTGGIPELVGDAAELVTPGDADGFAGAIERLLDDPGLVTERVTAAADRIAERYTAEANAAATLAVYERVLRERRRAG